MKCRHFDGTHVGLGVIDEILVGWSANRTLAHYRLSRRGDGYSASCRSGGRFVVWPETTCHPSGVFTYTCVVRNWLPTRSPLTRLRADHKQVAIAVSWKMRTLMSVAWND